MVFPLQSNAYRMGSNSSAVPSIPQIKTATGQVRRGLQDITNSSQFGAAAGAESYRYILIAEGCENGGA